MKMQLRGRKTAIGMIHLAPLPGSPFYKGMSHQEILDRALRDRDALLAAGFDVISMSNEGDRPYLHKADIATVATFSAIAARVFDGFDRPFGCGYLIDPEGSLAIARAIGADFIRISFGVNVGCFGLHPETPADPMRYRVAIGAEEVGFLMNLSPHFGTSLDTRDPVEQLRTYLALVEPDGVQVHGAGAGVAPDFGHVARMKEAAGDIPVLVASGTNAETVGSALEVSDGVIVGTTLKEEGYIWNLIDPERAKRYMDQVRNARGY